MEVHNYRLDARSTLDWQGISTQLKLTNEVASAAIPTNGILWPDAVTSIRTLWHIAKRAILTELAAAKFSASFPASSIYL